MVLDAPLALRQNHQRAKLEQQRWNDQQKKDGNDLPLFPIVDDVSADNLCIRPASELMECFVDDLLKMGKGKGQGTPAEGKFLRVKMIAIQIVDLIVVFMDSSSFFHTL